MAVIQVVKQVTRYLGVSVVALLQMKLLLLFFCSLTFTTISVSILYNKLIVVFNFSMQWQVITMNVSQVQSLFSLKAVSPPLVVGFSTISQVVL